MARDRKACSSIHWPWLLSAALATLGLPARADWLVTRDGQVLETEGAWTVDGKLVKFKTTAGTLSSMRTSEVDLDASRAETAKRAEPPPPPTPAAPPKKAVLVLTDRDVGRAKPSAAAAVSPVILYMTSWCPYCRQARELLTKLDEPFVEKNIESGPAVHEEYRVKGQGYKGIPMLDIDGQIVQGFREEEIRRLVQARREAARSAAQKAEPNPEGKP